MRILTIVDLPWDTQLGAARIFMELSRAWAAAGHDVSHYCLGDVFPAATSSPPASAWRRLRFPAKAAAFVRNNATRFDVIDCIVGALPVAKKRLNFAGLLVARSIGSHRLYRDAAVARERVVFRGPIFDVAVLEEEFRAARIFAYPSLAMRGETFGLAPLEAMTHGCAVLVSDLGCFRDFILPNETGFVFEGGAPNPADSLVVAFRDALSDPVRLERIARAGQLKSEEFSRARVADKFLIDFEKLISDAERTNR